MTGQWLLLTVGVIILIAVVAVAVGKSRERTEIERTNSKLMGSTPRKRDETVDFDAFSELPPPVARYFRHVLTDGQEFIHEARMEQSGVLRTGTATRNWLPFTAIQTARPSVTGFVWNAKVVTPLATHIRVLDSYIAGVGSGRVSVLSAFKVGSENGAPELNSGALHRYLAEAVWYPTALLPQSGVEWTPIDENTALATLTDASSTVSLEFSFNEIGEVTGIYSPGRFGTFDGGYKRVPWQGRFSNYQQIAGMRVPQYGEVGWYENGALELVWKGSVVNVQYEFAP